MTNLFRGTKLLKISHFSFTLNHAMACYFYFFTYIKKASSPNNKEDWRFCHKSPHIVKATRIPIAGSQDYLPTFGKPVNCPFLVEFYEVEVSPEETGTFLGGKSDFHRSKLQVSFVYLTFQSFQLSNYDRNIQNNSEYLFIEFIYIIIYINY